MCGLCGVFQFGVSREIDTGTLRAMTRRMAHRGPDGEGFWVSADRQMALGHRRLAIVEPGPLAAQPMANEDGTVQVAFNGEIYNHAALRRLLEDRGHRFRTDHSDTEVIVHGYEEWGVDCASHLEGEFAFAVIDERRRRLLLARDRMGVKPLYFSWQSGAILFASEIKALLAHPGLTPAMSAAAFRHYLTFLTTPAPMTLFEGIFKVPAAGTLLVDHHGAATANCYWRPAPPSGRWHDEIDRLSAPAQEDFCSHEILRLLDQSIDARMMSDVPFGVLLSGGLDSSTNVALMSRHTNTPVRTFTVGYSDHTYPNEFAPARRIAEHFHTDHHEIAIDESDALRYLPDLVYQQDEPLADWVCIPLYFVSRLARDSGTPVVQIGEGSDELFGGYSHYQRYLTLDSLAKPFARLPAPLRRLTAAMASAAASTAGRAAFYADALDRAARGAELFWGGAVAFWERDKRALIAARPRMARPESRPEWLTGWVSSAFLTANTGHVVDFYRQVVDRHFPAADFFTRMTFLECSLRLPELLLMRADKITMSASVEARVPFLDHRLVEFVMGVPASLKIKDRIAKYLLKKSVDGVLPDDVIRREKVGFNAPMREWLRGELGRHVERTVTASPLVDEGGLNRDAVARLFARHRAGSDLSVQIWTLYNAAAWFDRWIAGRSAA